MASGHSDPKLLYAITGVSAYHVANGKEESLTPGGPQTLSLLMVPTSSPFADPTQASVSETPEEDFYLHLHLPPELDLPLPATTQIYHKPPSSYLIPRWDLGRESRAFTRIEFPDAGSRKGLQEDVDTFETILAQCTAFLERVPPPANSKDEKFGAGDAPEKPPRKGLSGTPSSSSRKGKAAAVENLPAYNPANFAPGEAYVQGSTSSEKNFNGDAPRGGQLVLVDEEDGSVIGELSEGFDVVEDSKLEPGSKEPVEITLPTEGNQAISIAPVSQDYVEMSMHPAYRKSSLVNNASAASRLIVTTSDMVAKMLYNQADSFTKKTEPTSKPLTFKPSTHQHVRRISTFTGGAAELSSKTVGGIGKVAQNLGATIARRGGKKNGVHTRGIGPDGQPVDDYKPGILNKSLMAFSTVADGIEQAGRNLLTSTTTSATTVVTHRWGPEAGELSKNLGGGVKNVGLVYIDVTGVSRRAVLKSVAKGMVIGKTADGGQVVVGGNDSEVAAIEAAAAKNDTESVASASVAGGNGKAPAMSGRYM